MNVQVGLPTYLIPCKYLKPNINTRGIVVLKRVNVKVLTIHVLRCKATTAIHAVLDILPPFAFAGKNHPTLRHISDSFSIFDIQ